MLQSADVPRPRGPAQCLGAGGSELHGADAPDGLVVLSAEVREYAQKIAIDYAENHLQERIHKYITDHCVTAEQLRTVRLQSEVAEAQSSAAEKRLREMHAQLLEGQVEANNWRLRFETLRLAGLRFKTVEPCSISGHVVTYTKDLTLAQLVGEQRQEYSSTSVATIEEQVEDESDCLWNDLFGSEVQDEQVLQQLFQLDCTEQEV